MSITGDANSGPAKAGMSIVDLTTGMFAAYGILSALFSVQNTGIGQFVDVSLLDGQVVLLNHLALHHTNDWVLSA
jgi:crotonobetainyl-CoA:carnitine CoA-transferase CaiB-like acyl-CoA transferase